jgi:phage gpG-like protein
MITLRLNRAIEQINNIEQNLNNLNWNRIGRIGLNAIEKNFQMEGRYSRQDSEIGGSKKWEKRKDNLSHPILSKSRKMRGGIRAVLTGRGVKLISDEIYSATQNYGDRSRNIPARPFMTLHPSDIRKMEEEIVRQLTTNI